MSDTKVTVIFTDADHKRRFKLETNLEGFKKVLESGLKATDDKPVIPPRAEMGG